jgi:hypothetical protein
MHTMPCMGADCSTYSNGKHCNVLFRWRSSYSLLWKLVTLYTLAGILQMCCMPCWPAATTSTMEQQVQVLQVCPSWSCLSHLLSLTCRLKVCKLVEPWVHEQHCACSSTHYSVAFSRCSSHTRILTLKLLMQRPFVCTFGCFKACCNAGFKIGAVDTAAGVKGSCKESLLCVVLKQLKSHDCSIEEMPKELAPVRAAGDLQVINRSITFPVLPGSSENPADNF